MTVILVVTVVKGGDEKMELLIPYILTAIVTVVSGLVLFYLQRFFTKQRNADEDRERKKAHENALLLRSINALGNLTVANSIALRDGKTNGEMKAALAEYEEVNKEMYAYIITNYSKAMQ